MLGLANIYAFNDVEECVYFVEWMFEKLLEAHWVVCGSFNMFMGG